MVNLFPLEFCLAVLSYGVTPRRIAGGAILLLLRGAVVGVVLLTVVTRHD